MAGAGSGAASGAGSGAGSSIGIGSDTGADTASGALLSFAEATASFESIFASILASSWAAHPSKRRSSHCVKGRPSISGSCAGAESCNFGARKVPPRRIPGMTLANNSIQE